MEEKKCIKLQQIKNPLQKDILLHLKRKNKCVYGEIIKELSLPQLRGEEAIYALISKGIIKHKGRSSFLKLNVELME